PWFKSFDGLIRLALPLVLAAQSAAADGLMESTVTFGALAYDDAAAPTFVGARHSSVVKNSIEYGLKPEGVQNGWDIVPAIIDIRDQQIVVTYPDNVSGTFPA
ncbi:MAG: hypothetical protein ACI9RO_001022, partial [Alteromonas macleodii]